jgi:hypothetical protein
LPETAEKQTGGSTRNKNAYPCRPCITYKCTTQKKHKAMADKSAEKERLFNEWFTKSYDRLRGTLRRYGMLDEDNFHDTYLFVRCWFPERT